MINISECAKCSTLFRDAPDTAGVCPRCGHENTFTDDDLDFIPARKVAG